jgi:hypothetical protein
LKQQVGRKVVSHEYIHEAVAVIVGEGNAHSFAGISGDTGLFRDVGESAIAVVPIQRVVERLVASRVAIVALAGSPQYGSWLTSHLQ